MDDAWVVPGFRLKLAAAQRMIDAALASAQNMIVEVCVVVADTGGNLLAFARMDGARVSVGHTAIAKARSAVIVGKESGGIEFELGLQIAIAHHGEWSSLKGGVPVIYRGSVVDGIGVGSATTEQDIAIARTAVQSQGLSATWGFDNSPLSSSARETASPNGCTA